MLEFRRELFRSDRKSTRLNSSHTIISYAVFCVKKTAAPVRRRSAHPPHSRHRKLAHAAVRGPGAGEERAHVAGRRAVWMMLSADLFFFHQRRPPRFLRLALRWIC